MTKKPGPGPITGNPTMDELYRLRLVTACRDSHEEDLAALFWWYAEELAAYSNEVVRTACREWSRTQKFWPALSELLALCEQVRQREAKPDEEKGRPP
jgi:hypothetical protein